MQCLLFKNQHRSRNRGGPQPTLVAYSGLSDVAGTHDLVRDAVDLLLLVPTGIRIEFDVKGGCEHLGGQFLGVFAGLILGLAKTVVFAQVAVCVLVRRYRHADAGHNQPVRLACGVLRDDGKNYFAMIQVSETFLARNHLAPRWKDRRNTHEILRGDPRIPKRQLKGSETLLVFAYSLGKEKLLREDVYKRQNRPLRTNSG